jgi:tetratricopeptide (TPR) repeat protein
VSREAVAWCDWQIGELHFSIGAYAAAERAHRGALEIVPAYPRSLVGLGRARAAQGAWDEALESYARAVELAPEPETLAAAADLYTLAGRERDAAAMRALLDRIVVLSGGISGQHARALARIYADRGERPGDAYAAAKAAYRMRRDVHGADTLAWAALQAGHMGAAERAMRDALRLGTRDARMHYHAGRIALASGSASRARMHLERALAISPAFDPRQAPHARELLAELDGTGTPGVTERAAGRR